MYSKTEFFRAIDEHKKQQEEEVKRADEEQRTSQLKYQTLRRSAVQWYLELLETQICEVIQQYLHDQVAELSKNGTKECDAPKFKVDLLLPWYPNADVANYVYGEWCTYYFTLDEFPRSMLEREGWDVSAIHLRHYVSSRKILSVQLQDPLEDCKSCPCHRFNSYMLHCEFS